MRSFTGGLDLDIRDRFVAECDIQFNRSIVAFGGAGIRSRFISQLAAILSAFALGCGNGCRGRFLNAAGS